MADNTELDMSGSQSLIDMAKSNAKKLKENVMGTEAQNKAASARQESAAKKYPDSAQAKMKKVGFKKGGAVAGKLATRGYGCVKK